MKSQLAYFSGLQGRSGCIQFVTSPVKVEINLLKSDLYCHILLHSIYKQALMTVSQQHRKFTTQYLEVIFIKLYAIFIKKIYQ